MNAFQTRIRGFHARTVQNIMSKTICAPRQQKHGKSLTKKGDNLTTYLRKFQIDRQNLNLAKRILLCDSEHNHQKYKREWKKTQKFLRVRSNFKRNLCNQQPRIFKHQPVLGTGNMLVQIQFVSIQSNLINFRQQNTYSLSIFVKGQKVTNNSNQFTLETLKGMTTAFHIPRMLKNKKIWCYISEIKENNVYEKGKFWIKASRDGYQQSYIVSRCTKVVGIIKYSSTLTSAKNLENIQMLNLTNCSNKQSYQCNQSGIININLLNLKNSKNSLKKRAYLKHPGSQKLQLINQIQMTSNYKENNNNNNKQNYGFSLEFGHQRNQSTPNICSTERT